MQDRKRPKPGLKCTMTRVVPVLRVAQDRKLPEQGRVPEQAGRGGAAPSSTSPGRRQTGNGPGTIPTGSGPGKARIGSGRGTSRTVEARAEPGAPRDEDFREVTVQTDLYTAVFSEFGGRLKSLTLNRYRTALAAASAPKERLPETWPARSTSRAWGRSSTARGASSSHIGASSTRAGSAHHGGRRRLRRPPGT